MIAAATMMLTSCGLAEKAAEFGSPSMDSKSTYESLAKQVAEFDKGWKPFRLLVTNKGVNDECSNELSLAQVYIVNAENEKSTISLSSESHLTVPSAWKITDIKPA